MNDYKVRVVVEVTVSASNIFIAEHAGKEVAREISKMSHTGSADKINTAENKAYNAIVTKSKFKDVSIVYDDETLEMFNVKS